MLRIRDFTDYDRTDYSDLLPRAPFDVAKAMEAVRDVCDGVKNDGIEALRHYSAQFDQVIPDHFKVPLSVLEDARRHLDPDVEKAIALAIERRRTVCEQVEKEQMSRSVHLDQTAMVTNRLVPVQRVGLYVPGGLAPLASSVVMNAVPALVAGVSSLALSSPPQAQYGGYPHPVIMATCHMLGIEEVYAVGGAQAIAMFAHGVKGLCPKADLVTGPGNIYVVAAKRYLRGQIGIDSEAGPTEIAIIADETANPAYLAADLISQAEHDPLAGAVLITDSFAIAQATNEQITSQLEALDTRERLKISLTGEQSGIIVTRDLNQSIQVANDYAAEHLEICTRNAAEVSHSIINAGAIFIGHYSPVPLGDYCAGSTHVLPTSGAAKYSSGLTVRSFMRSIHVIDYSAEALCSIGQPIIDFAHAEYLPGHAAAISVRTQGDRS